MQLATANLSDLPSDVPGPTYDRGQVGVGVVHFGVGGFHRAHQAMYLDRLMNDGKALDWGICGVGVMPGDRRMKDAMDAQDCLYTLVVKQPDGTLEPQVIGSIVEYLFAPDDPDAVIERMADERTRVVSLTVTAGCDNIQGNGEVARRSFAAFARLRDEELGEWVEREVRFPNCMVDRITPVTTDHDREELQKRFGIEDQWPVVCEPFTQWVLEDNFEARPPLEDAGVQLVEDVEPYELMKLRLLNASHQAMAYLGYLSGYRYAHEVCQDQMFVDFLLGYMDREATPTLEPVPGVDLDQYKHTLIERFANAEVRDTLARLCAESSDRIPKWLLPVIRHQLETGGEVPRSALVVAAWARYAEGTDESGEPIQVVDRLRAPVMAAAASQRDDPLAFLRDRELFGDLVDDERFTSVYREQLEVLHTRGARAAVEALV